MNSGPQSWFAFTRLSKGLATLLVVGWVLQQALPVLREYGALVAGRTIPFAWNIFTAGFLESSLVKVTWAVIVAGSTHC